MGLYPSRVYTKYLCLIVMSQVTMIFAFYIHIDFLALSGKVCRLKIGEAKIQISSRVNNNLPSFII